MRCVCSEGVCVLLHLRLCVHRWGCQVGVAGGCVRWVCQVGVSGGFLLSSPDCNSSNDLGCRMSDLDVCAISA